MYEVMLMNIYDDFFGPRSHVGIKNLIIGGVNEDWPVDDEDNDDLGDDDYDDSDDDIFRDTIW
jgi:hypothetical protein